MSAIAGDSSVFGLDPDDSGALGQIRLARVEPAQRLDAAIRLVGDQSDDPYSAGQRFLESAAQMRIDLTLMWASVGPAAAVRQVALAVPGSGRTVMLFVSGPARRRRGAIASVTELGSGPGPTRERAAVIRAACAWVAIPRDGRPASLLAQTLLEQKEKEAIVAFRAAGFIQVGDLAYMRRVGAAPNLPRGEMDPAVSLLSEADLIARGLALPDRNAMFVAALERSYIDTKDCPELCGLRTPADVLDSHRLVGKHDPSLWWLVTEQGRPEGCLLLNVSPEHESVELVYLGLSPALRGRGLGARLLSLGLRHILGFATATADMSPVRRVVGTGGVTCAVDTRNTPAMKLYRAAGFQRFALRVPMVLGLATT